MKRVGCLLLALGASAAAGDAIEWAKDLETARAQSRRDKRPVLLYFTFET